MEYWIGTAASFRLDVSGPDHLGPLLGVVGDELPELGRRADKRCASKIGKPRRKLGIDEADVDLFVEFVDDRSGRFLRNTKTKHRARFVTGNEIAHGRDVWQPL